MVYIFIAEGFEEMEAIAPINILRRAKIEITTVGVGGLTVNGSHGIPLVADITDEELGNYSDIDMVVLPGGEQGVKNMEASQKVNEVIDYCAANDKFIAAICAAPGLLARKGLLTGKKATAFPGVEKELTDAEVCDENVVRDDKIITGKSAGVAPQFSFELVNALLSSEDMDQVKEDLQYDNK